jgi:hypothetical protein
VTGTQPGKRRGLAVRRLPEAGPSLEVILIEDAGAQVEQAPAPPHRHDYH